MAKKDKEIIIVDSGSFSDENLEIVSTVQPIPSGAPIIKVFSSDTGSGDIVQASIEEIQTSGFELVPKTVELLIKSVEDIKDLGVGFKIGCNLSLEGGAGGSFEKSPSKQTEMHIEKQITISYEVKKKD